MAPAAGRLPITLGPELNRIAEVRLDVVDHIGSNNEASSLAADA
jgi:hypothetical protein